jgi:hypothetical protein
MGRVITIPGIKNYGVSGKNSEAPVEPVFPVLRAFFDGGPGKTGVFGWCFCGEFVVDAWLNVVRKMAVLRGRKPCHFLQLYFQALFGDQPYMARPAGLDFDDGSRMTNFCEWLMKIEWNADVGINPSVYALVVRS